MLLRSLQPLAFITCFTLAVMTLQGCTKATPNTTADVTGGTVQGTESGKIISFRHSLRRTSAGRLSLALSATCA